MKLTQGATNRLVMFALGLGFLALVAAGAATIWSVVRSQQYARLVTHTYEVADELSAFQIHLERAENARRGYLLVQDPGFLQIYRASSDEVPRVMRRLELLVADNPAQRERLARLRPLIAEKHTSLARSMDVAAAGDIGTAVETFNEDDSIRKLRTIRVGAAAMAAEEDRLLAERGAYEENSLIRFYLILAGTGLLVALVCWGSFVIIRRNTRDLAASRDRLHLLNTDLEGAVAERTADLQRANDEIQRFAYIVSHDLRSPLVNVMGFTAELETATAALGDMIDKAEADAPEIVSEEARLAAREDLPEAIGFIRSSTQKMDRLINAILRLSREGRRVLRPERIEMNAMIREIADSLEHRLELLGAAIDVQPDLPDIVSDRLAIEQILSNIIENAVKYLKPGRPGRIAVRGERRGDRAVFEVEDNGRGIDPRDHERVFDLFRRSGAQDQPGEGIGLAHVRALAYRLGGIIDCESALDAGATFRLSIPAAYGGERAAS